MVTLLVLFVLVSLAVGYMSLPNRYRETSRKGVFHVTVVVTLVVAGFCTFVLISYGGYTWERMGVGMQNLRGATAWTLALIIGGVVVLRLIYLVQGKGIDWHENIVRMMAPYALWGYVQYYVALGIGANLILDAVIHLTGEGTLSLWVASIVTGSLFGAIHHKNKVLFVLTGVMGIFVTAIFLNHQNLIPLAFAHGILGTLQYYWVEGRDKWYEVIIAPK